MEKIDRGHVNFWRTPAFLNILCTFNSWARNGDWGWEIGERNDNILKRPPFKASPQVQGIESKRRGEEKECKESK